MARPSSTCCRARSRGYVEAGEGLGLVVIATSEHTTHCDIVNLHLPGTFIVILLTCIFQARSL